jgi:hypothetical protein
MGSNGTRSQVRHAIDQHHAEQQADLVKIMAEAAALAVADSLAKILPGQPWQPACHWCITEAKQAEHAWHIAVANAAQAGEPVPEPPPQPAVAQALTYIPVIQPGPGGGSIAVPLPACWRHIPGPAEQPRPTGLVGPDGQPIIARR